MLDLTYDLSFLIFTKGNAKMDNILRKVMNTAGVTLCTIPSCGIRYGISKTSHEEERFYNNVNDDQFVISWILTGSGSLWESGKEYKLGDMCVCLRRTGHDWKLRLNETPEKGSVRLFFDLPHKLYPALAMMIPELDFIAPVRPVKYQRELLNEFLSLFDEFSRTSATDVYILMPKLIHYIMNVTGILADRAATPMLQARAMLEDVSSMLSLEEIAALCGFNYNTFRKQFTETYGISPGQYRINCRMDSAKSALIAGESISSVAERLGYTDVYVFTHRFKDAVGVSPAKYRDEYFN